MNDSDHNHIKTQHKIINGKLFLVPVTLGDKRYHNVLPDGVLTIIKELRHFIVEDIRSARRFLRLIDNNYPIDETTFFTLNKKTPEEDIIKYLDPIHKGHSIGLMSEAGLPCIADPGAIAVELAHKKNIIVSPLTGPSSIIMALISSGLNGQNFSFNGYLPIKPAEREKKIRELEKLANRGITQIFMETPYRNDQLLRSVIDTCDKNKLLSLAVDITLDTEYITTKTISQWKRDIPVLKNRYTVFVL